MADEVERASRQSSWTASQPPSIRRVRRPRRLGIRGIVPTHPHLRPGSYGANLPFSYYGIRYSYVVPGLGWRLEYQEPGYGSEGTYWQPYDFEPFGSSYGSGCWFDPT